MKLRKSLLLLVALIVLSTIITASTVDDDEEEVPIQRTVERTPEAAMALLQKDLKLKPSAWRRRKILAKFLLQTGDSERALSEGLTAIQGAMAELEEAEKKLSRFLKLRTGVQDERHIDHERHTICQVADALHELGVIAEVAAEKAETGKKQQIADTLMSLCSFHAYEKVITRGACDTLKVCKKTYLRKLATKTAEILSDEKLNNIYAKISKGQRRGDDDGFTCWDHKKGEAFYAFGLATNRFVERLHHSSPEIQRYSEEVMRAVNRLDRVDTSIDELLAHGFDSFLKSIAAGGDNASQSVVAGYENRILAGDREGIRRIGAEGFTANLLLHPRQMPPQLFRFPSLRNPKPFLNAQRIPVASYLEEHFFDIREEVEHVLLKESSSGSRPFEAIASTEETKKLVLEGDWREANLYVYGNRIRALCDALPITCSIIEEFVEIVSQVHGSVSISRITSGTKIAPHVGPTNARWRLHLPLFVNVESGSAPKLTVGDEEKEWHEGHVLAFDDSFEHEVVFNGIGERVVLIIDIWPTEMTWQEREATIHDESALKIFREVRRRYELQGRRKSTKDEL